MVENGYVKAADGEKYKKEPLNVTARPTGAHIFAAEYFAEEVRREIYERYGEKKLYEGGLSVRATVDPEMQVAAANGQFAKVDPGAGKLAEELGRMSRIVDRCRPGDLLLMNESFSSTFALTAQMTLYDFGRSELAIEAARESVLATREALVTIEQQVLLNAVSAFVQVRLAEEFVKLGENSLRVIGEELKASQDRFEVGEITRTDVAQAEARLAQARSNLSSAEGELQVAREAYRAATGHYPGRLSAPPPPPITVSS